MFHVHRAERADRLADALGGILESPHPDPFAPEIVAVATRGMERWLTQTLSARLGASAGRRDGVCANVEFPFPGRLIGGALATASGIDPDADPWTPERMVWPLLDVIEAALDEPWLAPLAAHLAGAEDRRFARIRELAGLFDHYAIRRPALIESWAHGEGAGWQPELWRALRERIGVPSNAERLGPACERLRDQPELLALPSRIALFGLTRLPPGYVHALHAIASGRDVHLLLLHPSPALWQRIAGSAAVEPPSTRRAGDWTARLAANRLLASWGRDSRELQLVLAAAGETFADHHHPLPDSEPATLLAALQAGVRGDVPAPGPPLPGAPDRRLELTVTDTSIRIHACHGRRRQVEVMREAILHRLALDPTLEPRDVIVMCPDIESFAPLIQAVFGTHHGGDADAWGQSSTELRVRLADRSLRQTNLVLQVVARLLELASSRLTASEVLDLIDSEPVRRRFRFDDDALARIQEWIVDGAIHWGLDGEHRAAFKLGGLEAGTWASGVQRLLVGVALGESGAALYRGVLGVDDVDSGSIELAGRFTELIQRLSSSLRSLRGPHTIAGWVQVLTAAVDALTAVGERDGWQRSELARLLSDVVVEAAGSAASTRLALPEVRALLAPCLAGHPTRASFRTGHLTACTLVPMRSVPHRVVCLLGLDDGAFPRRTPRGGDDLLLADPNIGDRDPRSEDRQLLLDALLAAQDALIVTYSGRDERTNAPKPPAVPVGELLDAIDATARPLDQMPARERVVVHHPLQPFDPRNFAIGRLIRERPWSFDEVAHAGARAREGPRRPPAPFLASRLAPLQEGGSLALADLVAFVERPVRAFLRQRLGISAVSYDDEVRDDLPVALDALDRWGVGQRLLEGIASGIDPRDAVRAEIARGTLPPGALGRPELVQIRNQVAPLLREAKRHAGGAQPASLETNLRLSGGERLTGTVTGVRGLVLLSLSYSRLSARHRLAAWVRLLALSAAHPEVAFESVTIGRARPGPGGGVVAIARIPALGRDPEGRRLVALGELERLAQLRGLGLREPLPLPCLTAAAYAAARILGRADEQAAAVLAAREWTSRYEFENEDAERDHVLAFGGVLTFEELLAQPPGIEEQAEGWDAAEATRFGRYARRLWAPLLGREAVDEL